MTSTIKDWHIIIISAILLLEKELEALSLSKCNFTLFFVRVRDA